MSHAIAYLDVLPNCPSFPDPSFLPSFDGGNLWRWPVTHVKAISHCKSMNVTFPIVYQI
jgi:hypothetical protein